MQVVFLLVFLLIAIFCFMFIDTRGGAWFLIIGSLIANAALFPLALFIGVMATDSGKSFQFILAFLLVQGFPLLILCGSIYKLSRVRRKYPRQKKETKDILES